MEKKVVGNLEGKLYYIRTNLITTTAKNFIAEPPLEAMTTLEAGPMNFMMVVMKLYKCLHGMSPPYIKTYIQEWRVSDYNLRG